MKEEQLIRGNGIKSRIGQLDYDNCALKKLIETGKTSLLDGIIDADLGYDVITEQIRRNEKEIIELEKEFDEL